LEDFFVQLPAYLKYYEQKDQDTLKGQEKKLNITYISFLKIMTDELWYYNKIFQENDANPYVLYSKIRTHFTNIFA